MALRHAGQDRAGQPALAVDDIASGHSGQRPGGRHAQCKHRLGYQIFAQHRPQPGAAIARAAVGGRARAFQLDIASHPVAAYHFAQQNRPAIAQCRVPMAKLMARIGLRDGLRSGGQRIAGQHLQAVRRL